MDIVLVGLNYRTAPIEVREPLAVSEAETRELLPVLRRTAGADEVLVLSTCNRTEIVAVASGNDTLSGRAVLEAFCEVRGRSGLPVDGQTYELHGEEAVRQLLTVAAGLDSMVLGEPQILGQLKQAYAAALEAGTSGQYLNQALHAAFRAGKRVRTETELGMGALSVAHVAVTMAEHALGDFGDRTALVIGAGEMAEAAAGQLRLRGVGRLVFVNRTNSRAEGLAAEYDGQALPFAELPEILRDADLVISSTGAPGLILTHEMFHHVTDHRTGRPIFLVDIAMPRDIDPEIRGHENAFLYDVDDLRSVAEENRERRERAVPRARSIVEGELARFLQWQDNRKVEPLIKQLYERFDEVRRGEVDRNVSRFHEEEREHLEKLTASIQTRVLHRASQVLRQYDPETDEGRRALDVVRELFDLQ